MTEIDRELRAGFDELRARDAESAPDFDAVWQQAARGYRPPRRRLRRTWWLAAAGVAAGVAAVGAGVAIRQLRPTGTPESTPQPVSDAVAALVRWTPPTDGFLPASRTSMGAAPAILQSVFDGVLPAAIDTSSLKGD